MSKLRFFAPALILCLVASSAAFALSGGGCNDTCEYPYDYPLHYFSTTDAATATEAMQKCSEQMVTLDPSWNAFGFIIHWLGGDPPSEGEPKRYSCYACVDAVIPDPFEEALAPDDDLSLGTASNIATGVYGGEVSAAQRFFITDGETGRSGAGYFLNLTGVAEFEGTPGLVVVEPFYGEMIRHHPVNCEER